MKRLISILAIIIFTIPAIGFADSIGPPACTQDEAWASVLDNAYQVAEDYAMARNPRSTFITSDKDYSFTKQVGGSYPGKYLLTITTEHGKDYSVAVLLPLFDVNQSPEFLNIEKPLWKVLSAELNGEGY